MAVGKLLKEAVNLPCCSPEVWGLLGRYYSLSGQLESAKEAILKQVCLPVRGWVSVEQEVS
jgi:hypothetical protein